MLYADKRFLVHAIKTEIVGDIITTDQLGNQSVIPEGHFEENYIHVKKAKKINTYDIADIADNYAQGWITESNNQEDYIFEVKDKYINKR
jgi:hypothetical protein